MTYFYEYFKETQHLNTFKINDIKLIIINKI